MKPCVLAAVPFVCMAMPAASGSTRIQVAPVPPPVVAIGPSERTPRAPSPPSFSPSVPKDTPFLTTMAREMAGQPVVAVDAGWTVGPADGVKGRAGQTLLARLQDICEAFQSPQTARTPFAVRGVWSLAPASGANVKLDYADLSPVQASGRGALLTQVFGSLTAMQARQLAQPNGLPVSALGPTAQEMVIRALRPPIRLVQFRLERIGDSPDAMRVQTGPIATISTPPDPRSLRLRAQLRSAAPNYIEIHKAEGNTWFSTYEINRQPNPPRLEVALSEGESIPNDADIEALRTVPNAFKPSDLEAERLKKPIGIQGVHSVEEVLAAASRATGLTLLASRQYRPLMAFVGSASSPTGDVLDALRLALTAAFRKVGPVYLLAWDRQGVATLQTLAMERMDSLRRDVRTRLNDATESDIWLTLATILPFAADDPLAWTNTQRKAILTPRPENYDGSNWPVRVMWPQMTPSQQQAVRGLVRDRDVWLPGPTGEAVRRTMAEADMPQVALPIEARLELVVLLPEQGWVVVGDWWSQSLDANRVQSIRDQQRRRAETARMQAEAEARASAEASSRSRPASAASRYVRAQPHSLSPAKRRAVLVPALPPDSAAKVIRLMAARGFDTLFYPVLTEGYATFPSKAFPPHPSITSQNGWAAVQEAARGTGVAVVGYVELLAWRKPGAASHWLDRFPDYLDRDELGRTFSESVAAAATRAQVKPPSVVGDLVRIAEPDVERRLKTLLTEYMAQPGSAGLLVDAWSPDAAVDSFSPMGYASIHQQIRLGFAVPDRLLSIKRDGVDPVDVPSSYRSFAPPELSTPDWVMPGTRIMPGIGISPVTDRRPLPSDAPAVASYIAFAAKLIPKARSDGKPWTTYAVAGARLGYDRRALPPAPPVGTVLVRGPSSPMGDPTSVVFRILKRSRNATPASDWRNGIPAIAMAEGQNPSVLPAPWALVVYDFRDAPEELIDSLRRVGLPED